MGKLHHGICALVAGLMIHAALIACLPLVWCFGSNTVHAAERTASAPAVHATVSANLVSKTAKTAVATDVFTSPLSQKCVSHHKLMDVGPPVSKPAPDKDKVVAVVPNHDQLTWCSPQRVVQSTWAGQANFSTQLQHRSTVVLLI